MPRKLTPAQIGAVLLLAVFTVFITWRVKEIERGLVKHEPAEALMNKKAPDFNLKSNAGRTISLADYRGKNTVIVSYWASWCGPCRLELPELSDFYRKYHKDDSDFEILAVSVDENPSAADDFANQEKLPFPVLYDPDNKAADAYSIEAIPTLFVVDKSGDVSYAKTGLDELLEMRLAQSLGIKLKVPGAQPPGSSDDHDSDN